MFQSNVLCQIHMEISTHTLLIYKKGCTSEKNLLFSVISKTFPPEWMLDPIYLELD